MIVRTDLTINIVLCSVLKSLVLSWNFPPFGNSNERSVGLLLCSCDTGGRMCNPVNCDWVQFVVCL